MGSFSVTCGLSGFPICGGEEIVLFPLEHQGFSIPLLNNEKQGVFIITNSGAFAMYKSLAFPIFGEYDEYGRCVNIQRDDNTAVIEEYFGITIDEFATIIEADKYMIKDTEIKKARHQEVLERSSGMFMLKSVYDAFIDAKMGEFGSGDLLATKMSLGIFILKKLGFEYQKEDMKDKRSCSIYTHDQIPDLVLKSAGSSCDAKYKGKEIDSYNAERLKEELAGFGVDLDYCGLDGLSQYEIYYDIIQEKLLAGHKYPVEVMTSNRFSFGGVLASGMEKSYIPAIKEGKLKELYVGFHTIAFSMYLCNMLFMPNLSGPQFGAHAAQKLKGELLLKLANAEIKQREEDALLYG